MSLFWTVTLVQLRGLLASIGGGNTRKPRPRSGWLVLGLFAGLALYLSSTYSFLLAAQLSETGNVDLVLALMPLMALAFAVLLGGQAAGTFVFAGRDNDLLLALPIPRLTLALAKLAAVGLENLLLMVCMLAPAGVAYAGRVETPPWFWPALAVDAVLLALLATAASVLLGLGISVVRNLRRGTLIVNVTGMVLMVAFLVGTLAGQVPLVEMLRTDPAPVRAWLGRWAPLLLWVRDLAIAPSVSPALLLVAATAVPFALVAWLVGRSFVALVSGAATRRGAVRIVRAADMRARTPFVALVRREAQRFFGSTIYFLNTGVGLAILLLGAGYLFVVGTLPSSFAEVAAVVRVPPALLLALAAAGVLTTVNTAAPSISLEGQRLWIVKGAPLKAETILGAKVAFNVALVTPPVLVFAIAAARATGAGLAEVILLIALPLAFITLAAELGLLANLTWPNLDAPNDTLVVKQSAAVVASLFEGMGAVLIAAVVGLLLARPLGATWAFTLVTLGLITLALAAWSVLRTWGVRTFATL